MTENRLSPITQGQLELQVARLQQLLKLVEKQQLLSKPYPKHKARLIERQLEIQQQLQQLLQDCGTVRQDEFLQ
jgi:hypothetical protein